jgi:PhnB protein
MINAALRIFIGPALKLTHMPKNPKIPANYQTVMPYLIVNDASAFIEFMRKVFGAKETYKAMRDPGIIMHGEIMIGECTIMFAESTEQYPPTGAGLFIYVENADESYNKAIAEGASPVTDMSDQPYGRSGGVEDPFGNTWWVTTVK